MNFGEFMRKARKGISYYQLSLRTGITAAMLSKYEKGQSQPTLGNAEKICVALGVSYTIGA